MKVFDIVWLFTCVVAYPALISKLIELDSSMLWAKMVWLYLVWFTAISLLAHYLKKYKKED